MYQERRRLDFKSVGGFARKPDGLRCIAEQKAKLRRAAAREAGLNKKHGVYRCLEEPGRVYGEATLVDILRGLTVYLNDDVGRSSADHHLQLAETIGTLKGFLGSDDLTLTANEVVNSGAVGNLLHAYDLQCASLLESQVPPGDPGETRVDDAQRLTLVAQFTLVVYALATESRTALKQLSSSTMMKVHQILLRTKCCPKLNIHSYFYGLLSLLVKEEVGAISEISPSLQELLAPLVQVLAHLKQGAPCCPPAVAAPELGMSGFTAVLASLRACRFAAEFFSSVLLLGREREGKPNNDERWKQLANQLVEFYSAVLDWVVYNPCSPQEEVVQQICAAHKLHAACNLFFADPLSEARLCGVQAMLLLATCLECMAESRPFVGSLGSNSAPVLTTFGVALIRQGSLWNGFDTKAQAQSVWRTIAAANTRYDPSLIDSAFDPSIQLLSNALFAKEKLREYPLDVFEASVAMFGALLKVNRTLGEAHPTSVGILVQPSKDGIGFRVQLEADALDTEISYQELMLGAVSRNRGFAKCTLNLLHALRAVLPGGEALGHFHEHFRATSFAVLTGRVGADLKRAAVDLLFADLSSRGDDAVEQLLRLCKRSVIDQLRQYGGIWAAELECRAAAHFAEFEPCSQCEEAITFIDVVVYLLRSAKHDLALMRGLMCLVSWICCTSDEGTEALHSHGFLEAVDEVTTLHEEALGDFIRSRVEEPFEDWYQMKQGGALQ